MKENFMKYIKAGVLILGMSLLFSCSNIANLFSDVSKDDSGKCEVSINVASLGRTVSPELTASDMTFTLYGTPSSGTKQTLFSNVAYTALNSKTFYLEAGDWSFTLDGIKNNLTVMEASVESTISASSSSISFALKPVTDGTGATSIILSYPENYVTKTVITIKKGDSSVATATFTSSDVSTTDSVSTVSYQNANLTPGTYLVNYNFTYGAGKTYNYPETLTIYRDCTSTKSYAFTEKSFTTVDNFICTESNISTVLATIKADSNYSASTLYTLIVDGAVTDFSTFLNALTSASTTMNFYLDFSAATTNLTTVTNGNFTACTGLYEVTLPAGVTGLTTYTVTFDSKCNGTRADATAVDSQSGVLYGRKIVAPKEPTSENYSFTSWYKTASLTYKYSFDNNTVVSDLTLYAGWAKELTVSVTLLSGGGVSIAASDISTLFTDYSIKNESIVITNGDNKKDVYLTGDSMKTAYFYPFVDANTEYTFEVIYEDNNEIRRAYGKTTITTASYSGTYNPRITNANDIAWSVTNHVFHWDTAPVLSNVYTASKVEYQMYTPIRWGWLGKYTVTDSSSWYSDFNINTVLNRDNIPYEMLLKFLYIVTIDSKDYYLEIYRTDPFYLNNGANETQVLFESNDDGLMFRIKEGTDLSSYNITTLHLGLSGDISYNYTINMTEFISDGNTVDAEGFYNILLPYITSNIAYTVTLWDNNWNTIFSSGYAETYGNNCKPVKITWNNKSEFIAATQIDADTLKISIPVEPEFTYPSFVTPSACYFTLYSGNWNWILQYNCSTFTGENDSIDLCNDMSTWDKYNYNIKSKISDKSIFSSNSMDFTLNVTDLPDYLSLVPSISLGTTDTVEVGTLTATVTLNPNGGTFADNTTASKVTSNVALGTTISSLLPTTNPTKAGYTFGGWAYVSGSGNVLTTASGAISTIGADMTLTAQWTAN